MNGRIQKFDFEENQSTIYDDIMSALLWQYNDAKNLTSLITKKAQWFDTNYKKFWRNWFTNVFDLYTCDNFGITLWSIILDLPIQTDTEIDPRGKPIFNFGPDDEPWRPGFGKNFENSTFTNINTRKLTINEKRFMLLLRFFQLQSRGALPEINKFLSEIIYLLNDAGETLYVVDEFEMAMTYIFTFRPSQNLIASLYEFDVLPRPAGVRIKIMQPLEKPTFGFGPDSAAWEHGYGENFTNSNFIGED